MEPESTRHDVTIWCKSVNQVEFILLSEMVHCRETYHSDLFTVVVNRTRHHVCSTNKAIFLTFPTHQ